MHILLLAPVFLLGVAAAPPDHGKAPAMPSVTPFATADKPMCENARGELAKYDGATVQLRKLSEEPLANQYLGVLRLEGGCDKPVKVREQVGGQQR